MDAIKCKCRFKLTDWNFNYQADIDIEAPLLPARWQQKVKKMDLSSHLPADCKAECKDLSALIPAREDRRDEIELQAIYLQDALWPVQAVVGSVDIPYPRIHTKLMIGALLDNLIAPVMMKKMEYMRGRPQRCCAKFKSMYPEKDNKYHPGHPAFPAGHAVSAYSLAYIYSRAEFFPHFTGDLFAAADGIVRNREIAGFHYPSDGRGGKRFAELMVALLCSQQRFQALMKRARAEW